jgi:hypothetical protein
MKRGYLYGFEVQLYGLRNDITKLSPQVEHQNYV